MNKVLMVAVLVFVSYISHAQLRADSFSVVSGKVISAMDSATTTGIKVNIPRLKMLTTTDKEGGFRLEQVRYGIHTLIIIFGNGRKDSMKVLIDGPIVDLGVLKVNFNVLPSEVIGSEEDHLIMEEEEAIEDNGITDQAIHGILKVAGDPYLSTVSSCFNAFSYRIRGYKSSELEVYMDGLLMNDLKTNTAIFRQWGGLRNSFRNQNTSFALQAAEDGFGGLTGLVSLSSAAAGQRKQASLSYGVANSTYRNEICADYNTGLMNSGWAFSFAFSKRWAKQGYVEGNSYNGYSFYASVSKKLGAVSILHLTAFATPTVQSLSTATTLEAMELAGTPFYNPNWGNLNGEKRNAKVNRFFQPVAMLHYDYTPDNNTKLSMVGSFGKGYNANSLLDWYNARDPRPDYYKNLSSYYENDESIADPAKAAALKLAWQSSPDVRQLDWKRMYETNTLNKDSINGIAGKRSAYMVGEDREDSRKYGFAVNLQKVIQEGLHFSSGISLTWQQTDNYRKMVDLLGGDYYVDLNQFAERTYVGNTIFNQNDLNNPDRIVKTGDRYSYNYMASFRKIFAWGQLVYTKRKMDLFLAARFGQDVFKREGHYRNGLFADDSYGTSGSLQFYNYQLKSGITYKIKGRQDLYVNAALMTAAPLFDHTFISPRTRNIVVDQPVQERTESLEGGYRLHTPKLAGRLSGFATRINDGTRIMRFYHDDYRAFVNYVMRNINVQHIGGELALQVKMSPAFSASALVSWKQVFYASNPEVSIYRDNDTTMNIGKSVSYMKYAFLAVGPQSACHLDIGYKPGRLWYFKLGAHYLNRNYADLNPVRRTEEAVNLLNPQSEEWHRVVDQKELSAAFTVDLSAGKSYQLSKKRKGLPGGTWLYINISVNNLLNNKSIQATGSEQLRFDTATANPDLFPPKYTYTYGTSYIARLGLRF